MNGKRFELIADMLLLSVTISWGSTFVIVKKAIEQIPTFAFLSLRFWIASLLLWIIMAPRLSKMKLSIVKDGIVLGTILFLAYAFQTVALLFTYSSIVGFLTGLNVAIVPFLAIFITKRPPKPQSLIGVLLSIIGMTLLSVTHGLHISEGDWLTIICAVFVALQIVMTDVYSRRSDPLLLTAVEITIVAIFSTTTSLLTEPYTLPHCISRYMVTDLVVTSMFATVYAFIIQNTMQRFTTPTKTAVIFTMEPVFAGVFGYLLGHELLSARQYLGALLIFIGILIMELAPAKDRSF